MTHPQRTGRRSTWVITLGCVAVILLAILAPRRISEKAGNRGLEGKHPGPSTTLSRTPAHTATSARLPPTPEEIVAAKINEFARDRLRITRAMAKRHHVELPDQVAQFFDAAGAGRWDELNDLYHKLETLRNGAGENDEHKLGNVWPPILETLLVAECSHAWPAQKLLDYGQATLGSLSPGMVYVGGTDPGRGIPTLLNETSGGERHVVLTQNALADATYLDYVRFLYGDQMTLPTQEDSKQAFDSYLADAQKRFQHDQQFPDEPKQVRPGEDIQLSSGTDAANAGDSKPQIRVSGNIAVMAINERILQGILDKNPGMSFALEESFPLLSTYASANPLGPLMQLGAPNGQNAFDLGTAGEALDYWRNAADQLQADADAPEGSEVRKAYSHMAAAQANLLASHNYPDEAEAAFRIAMELEPSNAEALYRLSKLLGGNGKLDEAQMLINDFARSYPDQVPPPDSSLTFEIQSSPH